MGNNANPTYSPINPWQTTDLYFVIELITRVQIRSTVEVIKSLIPGNDKTIFTNLDDHQHKLHVIP